MASCGARSADVKVQTAREVLANRRWLRIEQPFSHIVAQDIFTPEFYFALSAQLGEMISRGLSETPTKGHLSRNLPGYDAYGIGINDTFPYPLSFFVSPAWRDLMCGVFQIQPTPYVFAGIHYHKVGSANGFIHNDFNPVWFPRALANEIQVPNQELCSYKTGAGPIPESAKLQVVRGAVMIFYLLNDGWRKGDGGDTALYRSGRDAISNPAAEIGPENNSLIAFECTPKSFHAYRTNYRAARVSIIMWVHRELQDASSKFGAERLEHWKI